jgi:hypothetical protein
MSSLLVGTHLSPIVYRLIDAFRFEEIYGIRNLNMEFEFEKVIKKVLI